MSWKRTVVRFLVVGASIVSQIGCAQAQTVPVVGAKTVSFSPFKDPWTSARERYWDIDDNQFNSFVSAIGTANAYKYSNAQVTLTYDPAPSVPYFVGRITASGLKPNFLYQLKLTGKPKRGARGWGAHGDDWSNEQIGYAGRWWCDSAHSTQTNFNDSHFTAYYKNALSGEHDIYGYQFVGGFVTDNLGNANVDFTGQSSYHVDWQDKQNTSLKHVLNGTFRVGSAPSPYYGYGAYVAPRDVKLWYEYEAGRAQNNVQLPAGKYNCRFLLTEESFHNTSFYGGYWKTVLATEDFAKDASGEYLRNSTGALIPDSNAGNDVAFVIGLPSAPLNLTASASDSQVSLAWSAVSGASTYTLARGTQSGGPYQVVATNLTTTSYLDTNVQNGTTYFYVVSAVNNAGASTPSNQAEATPQGTPVAAPENLSAVLVSNQIDLNWSSVAGANSYSVYRGTTTGGPYTLLAGELTTTHYSDTSAQVGTTYFYVVTATGSLGEGPASNEATATTPTATAATPVLTPSGGTFSGAVNVAISCATPGAQIRYTLDGSTPTSTSALYSAPLTISTSRTVKARAFATNHQESAVASGVFVISQTQAFTPVADAHARGGNYAKQNFGSVSKLQVQNFSSSKDDYDAFLKFDLNAVANPTNVTSVKLRFYGQGTGKGSATFVSSAYAVSNVSWSESTLNWNNMPIRGALQGSASIVGTALTWYEIDVTSHVKTELAAGRRVVSIGLYNPSTSTRGLAFNSREASANRPQLVVVN